jgi:hypothetical protein
MNAKPRNGMKGTNGSYGLTWVFGHSQSPIANSQEKPRKVNAKRGQDADYCPRCGFLHSQCDCWDPLDNHV